MSMIDLIEELPAAVFVTDRAGRILQVNQTATEVLGQVREDLLGQSLAAFTHPDDLQRLIPAAAFDPGQADDLDAAVAAGALTCRR